MILHTFPEVTKIHNIFQNVKCADILEPYTYLREINREYKLKQLI